MTHFEFKNQTLQPEGKAASEELLTEVFDTIDAKTAKEIAIAGILAAKEKAESADVELRIAIALARRVNVSYRDIGDVFGITRQAAWEKYQDTSLADLVTENDG